MKCPNCGMELPENTFRCEKCGNDIHIVPDYDPELEEHISHSIGHVTEKLHPEDVLNGIKGEQKSESQDQRNGRLSLHFIRIAISVCLCGLIAAGFAVIISIAHFSYDYQIQKANSWMKKEQYDKAMEYYRRAADIRDDDAELYISMAAACYLQGNKLEYEYLLKRIISHPEVDKQQLEQAYGNLINIYKERGEFAVIHELLMTCDKEEIQKAYQSYIALPPLFNYEAGTYEKAIPLKLTGQAKGQIYYTLDGSLPDQNSLMYVSPILLENGNVIVTAMFVNEYGVESVAAAQEYNVIVQAKEGPAINVISGKYTSPMWIEVTDRGEKEVYYTLDGTVPNLHSFLYTGPISMPLGNSTFSFAYVDEEGTTSEVTVREYELDLQTDFDVEDAQALVVEHMLIQGKIMLENGLFSNDTNARYLYEYRSVIPLDGYGSCYIISEIYQDEEGIRSRTGSYFAVSIDDRKCYKMSKDEDGSYVLKQFGLETS